MSAASISVTLPPEIADIVGKGINQGDDEGIAFALRVLDCRARARRLGDWDGVRRAERDLVTTFSKEL